jgi:hypothetical protein
VVLVVSEVCAGEYRTGVVREGRARGAERIVDCSDSSAAVGVAEKEIAGY